MNGLHSSQPTQDLPRLIRVESGFPFALVVGCVFFWVFSWFFCASAFLSNGDFLEQDLDVQRELESEQEVLDNRGAMIENRYCTVFFDRAELLYVYLKKVMFMRHVFI